MAHVLATGGAGVIGSHLVDAFLNEGRSVTVLDDFSTGRRENLPGHGCEPILEPVPESALDPVRDDTLPVARLRIVCGDIRHEGLVDELAEGMDIRSTFRLCAVASVRRSIEAPLETMSVSTGGSSRLPLRTARSLESLARCVFASPVAVLPRSSDRSDARVRAGVC